MHVRRRNGLLASCEPCRKRKVGCDHALPTCSRCQRRGQATRCIYHSGVSTKEAVTRSSGKLRSLEAAPRPERPRLGVATTRSDGISTVRSASYAPSNDEPLIRQVKRLLRQLRHFDVMSELLREYYAFSQGPVVPGGLIFAILEAARRSTSLWQAIQETGPAEGLLSLKAEETICMSSCAMHISPSTTVSSFSASLCGETIRLEALGIVYSVAARACKVATRKGDPSHDAFINRLYTSSLDCRRIARDIAPMSDALLWLTYENVILTTYMHGDSSELVWQRLDSLCGDVLALGVHRESFNVSNTPLFLSELRRRTFHKAYGLDVYLAALFDRPPRLSKRHADCTLPLDLPDDVVWTDVASRSEDSTLSSEGWSLSGRTNCATWIRTRSLFSSVKEEIAECSILPPSDEINSRLQSVLRTSSTTLRSCQLTAYSALSLRLNEVWDALPPHIRATPTQYTSDAIAFHGLITTRLKFLQSDMHIHILMNERSSTHSVSEPLLRAAEETMALVLRLGGVDSRESIITIDFRDIVVGYGLASASIIARSLQYLAQQSAVRLPIGLSRATLLRNLLTFISHLEELSGDPAYAATAVFSDAARTLSRAVDDTLDPERLTASVTANEGRMAPLPSFFAVDESNIRLSSLQDPSAFEKPVNAETLDDLDLDRWLNSLDWNGATENWIDL